MYRTIAKGPARRKLNGFKNSSKKRAISAQRLDGIRAPDGGTASGATGISGSSGGGTRGSGAASGRAGNRSIGEGGCGCAGAVSAGGVTAPMRLRMICCRPSSRGDGFAGFSMRGLMMAPASSADSAGPKADAGIAKYVRAAASTP